MSPDRLSNLTIVVVEDHDDARRYLDLLLNQMGANVVVARNGFEGLEATKNNRPDLVVSDIKMPGMDGFELLRDSCLWTHCRRQCTGYRCDRLRYVRR
jgi:CheY-like chemotaxis protein